MTTSPNLQLPYLLAAQAQKHVTHNEALRVLDMLAQITILDRDLTAPPTSPADGARYLVAAGSAGAWVGQAGKLAAWQDGAWVFRAPAPGWLAWIADEARLLAYDGVVWVAGGGSLNPTPFVGVNATADTTNRLAVASPATLLSHEGDGHQLKINKSAAADTASLLLQTDFSARAEIGLAGSDDLAVKVSADGTTWSTALSIDRATGLATFALGAGRIEVQNFTASGTWTKPAWAKRVMVLAMGGAGGGGSGRRGAAASDRRGGGGGGAGGVSNETFLASELPASMSIDIGAGGAGGDAVTADNTSGNAGSTGGSTTFRDGATEYIYGFGGSGGAGGTTGTTAGGGGGTGTGLAANAGGAGGSPAGVNGSSGTLGIGPGGGAGGGGISTANTVGIGGQGGRGYNAAATARRGAGGVAGAGGAAGGDGGARAWERGAGGGAGGGGGGDSGGTAAGGAGGSGGAPGGGGGGGGAATNGADSGAGGAGARGEAWVMAIG